MPTSVASRPGSSFSLGGGPIDYGSHSAKLSRDFLAAPGFKKHLENFYKKASPEDQQRCLDLLSAINLGEEKSDPSRREKPTRTPTYGYGHNPYQYYPNRRPKTAMADIGCYEEPKPVPLGPYTTAYKRDFPKKESCAHAHRPGTSRGHGYQATYDLSGPVGNTTYYNEFYDKGQKKTPQIRAGSASGNRRNNPHPLESFMVWRAPQKPQGEGSFSEWYPELTDEMMDKVCRGKLMSTYQQDYLGIPQGFQVASAFDEREDWKSKVPYTLDSSTRQTYQKPPEVPEELKSNNTRFGCNRAKHLPANGVAPNISRHQMDIKTVTTYDREFTDPQPAVPRPPRTPYGVALQHRLDTADNTEKQMLQEMIQSVGGIRPPSYRPASSSSRSSRLRPTPLGA